MHSYFFSVYSARKTFDSKALYRIKKNCILTYEFLGMIVFMSVSKKFFKAFNPEDVLIGKDC
jgi:hypothetical protein